MSELPVPSFGFTSDHARRWIGARAAEPILTVDSHTAGNPTRIILGGVTPPPGVATVAEVRAWLRRDRDEVRRRLVHEPRGGALTCAVLPLPATDDSHDLGAVILEPGSYPPMCGHCMIGLAGAVAELDLVAGEPDGPGVRRLRIATPAGIVRARVELTDTGPRVSLENVPSYAVTNWTQQVAGREVRVDLAWGGDYYASVDAQELGIPLDREGAPALLQAAAELRAGAASRALIDPVTGERCDVYQVMFYAPTDAGHVDTVIVAPPGAIDRSPCGTGSSALLGLLVGAGRHDPAATLRTRGIAGGFFELRASATSVQAGRAVVVPEITGSAHLTGFAWTVVDPTDRLADGFPPL